MQWHPRIFYAYKHLNKYNHNWTNTWVIHISHALNILEELPQVFIAGTDFTAHRSYQWEGSASGNYHFCILHLKKLRVWEIIELFLSSANQRQQWQTAFWWGVSLSGFSRSLVTATQLNGFLYIQSTEPTNGANNISPFIISSFNSTN